MDWKGLKKRFTTTGSTRTAPFTLPSVLLEIQPDFIAGTRLAAVKHQREVRRIHVAALPPQAVSPHAGHTNVTNPDAVREAATAVMSALGNGSDRFGLLLSDAATRVGVLAFESLPDDHGDAEDLVRWKLGEGLPFPAEEARIHYQVLLNQPGHVEVLAVAGRDTVLGQYESVLGPARGIPALVLPATMALLPLMPERNDAGQLLLHLCCRWVTAVVVLGSRVCFWRTREVRPGDADMVADVATEAARVLAGARDHMQVEMGHVWLCARPMAPAGLEGALALATGCQVKELAPAADLGSLLAGEERLDFERYGAVAAGLASNSEAIGHQLPAGSGRRD
ncbi:MAG: hypothetical protein ACLQOO_12945 [Terriglobia bacterium]